MEFKGKTVLLIGGNSDVGKSLARDFSKLGSNIILTSRKKGELDFFKSDLEIRFSIKCEVEFFDVLDFNSHKSFYFNLKNKPHIVISCIGYLNNQEKSEYSFEESLKSIQTNFTGLVSILNIVSNDFKTRKSGIIAGISSVAGDRGRGSNYIYGCSKSAFSSYLSGLRNKLSKSGVHVITIKPGFIKTKMTNHLDLPKILTATPKEVSKDIIKSISNKKNIIYSKWYWRYIMILIKIIPESAFKNLKL